MTNQIRNVIQAEIAKSSDADRIARLELIREFMTNPQFASALSDHLWENRK